MGIKVLVIDDSPFVYKTIMKALENTDYEVVAHALNGQMGVEKYELIKPDIVTLDVTMPIMDGIEAARILYSKYPNIKIVLLSAMGDGALLDEAKSIGIKHFLTKPFKPDALIGALNEALA